MINGYFGWGMILTAFVTGAVLGVYFHRDDFLGGYSSFRRRILRLGHISLAALGMLNILYSLSPAASAVGMPSRVASLAFIVGGITMPAVCFLTSWRAGFRHWFFIPVIALIVAVIQTLRISSP
jgi:hypothetical protein